MYNCNECNSSFTSPQNFCSHCGTSFLGGSINKIENESSFTKLLVSFSIYIFAYHIFAILVGFVLNQFISGFRLSQVLYLLGDIGVGVFFIILSTKSLRYKSLFLVFGIIYILVRIALSVYYFMRFSDF